jgi:hypothetical protein
MARPGVAVSLRVSGAVVVMVLFTVPVVACRAVVKAHAKARAFFFWKALLLIRITPNGRRPAPNGAHRNWTY